MDIDHQNNKVDGVRDAGSEVEYELVRAVRGGDARTQTRDRRDTIQELDSFVRTDPRTLYLPMPNLNYGLPEQTSPVVLPCQVEDITREAAVEERDSSRSLLTHHHLNLHSGINGDASGNDVSGKERNAIGESNTVGLDPDTYISHRIGHGRAQRSGRTSIDSLLTGTTSLSRIHPTPATSTPTPATPEDYTTSYQHYIPGSVHSPAPLPLRARSSFGSTARPISNRRPGPVNTSRSRASPYLTSAARNEVVGLGINTSDCPSTPWDMHSISLLGMGPAQSPGSMSSRRRKAPEWPGPKSSRSHSFNRPTSPSTPKDMDQTIKTPAALRVPSTAQLSSRPGDMPSPMLIPRSASGVGPIRTGILPSSAPPVSARADTQSFQIPSTPRRVHLLDVPRAKVISTLNERAGKYWFEPFSSDCRIYVPIPPNKAAPLSSEATGDWIADMTSSWPPAPDCPEHVEGITGEERNVVNTRSYYKSRRYSQPDLEDLPVLVFHIHRDYIVTQSALLRRLLTATSPSRATFPQSPNTPQARSFPAPILRAPKEKTMRGSRVLPQREGEPVSIYMPIPDPASFGLVLHWLYWGDTPTIEKALSQGLATWQGVVKNIEYLALDDSIKRVIGKWWRTWVKTDVGRKSEQVDRKPSVSDTEVSKRQSGRGFSVESESTDDEREEDGMEVDLHDGIVVKEEDDGGVGDLLKNL